MTTVNEIKRDLNGLTIDRARALAALAMSNKQYPDTDDIRDYTGFDTTKLGGIASALTKIEIKGKNLLTVRPLRINRNTTQYIWHEKVATKEQIIRVLKEFGLSI